VFCPRNTPTKSLELVEDGVCGGGPNEGLGVGVVGFDEGVDFGDKIFDGGEGSPPCCAACDQAEEAFYLVEPGGVGGREVDLPARPLCKPGFDLSVLVGGVVVDNEMDVESLRDLGFDVAQKGEIFLMAMTRLALRQDRAVEHIERGEQGGSAVTLVIGVTPST